MQIIRRVLTMFRASPPRDPNPDDRSLEAQIEAKVEAKTKTERVVLDNLDNVQVKVKRSEWDALVGELINRRVIMQLRCDGWEPQESELLELLARDLAGRSERELRRQQGRICGWEPKPDLPDTP